MLELGRSQLPELGRRAEPVEPAAESTELRLSRSELVWRKMGISPELAREASASKLPRLPEAEGLGGLIDSRAWRTFQLRGRRKGGAGASIVGCLVCGGG